MQGKHHKTILLVGQMLLCAINSLFENIEGEMERLRERVSSAPTPTECAKFTTVVQALEIRKVQ
jgi:hypothetical protein